MNHTTIEDICWSVAETIKIYALREPQKMAQRCETIIRGCTPEIENRAKDAVKYILDENRFAKYANMHAIPSPIPLHEAMSNGWMDFSHLRAQLIPQETEHPEYTDNFIINILADALAMAMLKRCVLPDGTIVDATKDTECPAYPYGYARETTKDAVVAKKSHPQQCFTGLNEYLEVIFPGTEWVHDKAFGFGHKIRPDYKCVKKKIIVEFDGLQHYSNPKNIDRDIKNQEVYEDFGYKVIRVPYFVQLTREVIYELFGVDVGRDLCDPNAPSMGIEFNNTPAFCCMSGIVRMAREYKRFPQQYELNLRHLLKQENNKLTGVSILQWCTNNLTAAEWEV